jgi:site-specific DNA recombinase
MNTTESDKLSTLLRTAAAGNPAARNKRWRTRKGSLRGGKPFTRNSLHQLLTNVTYCGQIRYRQEVHPGEHAAIVDPSLWQQVSRNALSELRVSQPLTLGYSGMPASPRQLLGKPVEY